MNKKDNKADVPADPSLSVHAGRSDIPGESKSPIEATTVFLPNNSTEASDRNVFNFDSDPFFETELSGEDDDGWNDNVYDDPSAPIKDGRSNKPDEPMAPIEVTRVPMQDTPPEASYTTVFDLFEGDPFFDSSEEISDFGGSDENDNVDWETGETNLRYPGIGLLGWNQVSLLGALPLK